MNPAFLIHMATAYIKATVKGQEAHPPPPPTPAAGPTGLTPTDHQSKHVASHTLAGIQVTAAPASASEALQIGKAQASGTGSLWMLKPVPRLDGTRDNITSTALPGASGAWRTKGRHLSLQLGVGYGKVSGSSRVGSRVGFWGVGPA